ncbi:hypothetical protein EDB81DRAFT_274936 [Dactylonectria macrodidyma]|uniref:Uncharacterized protein n=1 Tax=Dactylonectria macrodidyma TaxID=307937 RepID=A0A9P9JK33_9HYPO|nr:hypothetical protein EDB81DRAFT_274936 [Dactylonectria macrodidyma]
MSRTWAQVNALPVICHIFGAIPEPCRCCHCYIGDAQPVVVPGGQLRCGVRMITNDLTVKSFWAPPFGTDSRASGFLTSTSPQDMVISWSGQKGTERDCENNAGKWLTKGELQHQVGSEIPCSRTVPAGPLRPPVSPSSPPVQLPVRPIGTSGQVP